MKLGLLFLGVLLVGIWTRAGFGQTAPGATQEVEDGVNLAVVAKCEASFVSPHEMLDGINNGMRPRDSADKRRGAYGNWPKTGTQWVQYEWDRAISTDRMEVYWFDDGKGVRVPTACRLQYWNGSAFVDATEVVGLGVLRNDFNLTSFAEISTTKLRLVMEGDGGSSTGVLQWKVYDSGKSPVLPPVTRAGVSRVVVVGVDTYLQGSAKTVKGGDVVFAWVKKSGTGVVAFGDERSPVTTARFSSPGDYVLTLTATGDGESSADEVRVSVTPLPPTTHLQPVYTKAYTIDSPFWDARIKGVIVNWIPHCVEEISDLNLKEGGINNFIQAGNKLAGKPYTRHVGYPFSNAWVHNTVESMCVALLVDPKGDAEVIKAQNAMRTKLEEWIPIILSAQEPDGYLQTRFMLGTDKEPEGFSPPHWSVRYRGEHEGYVGGYFIESGIAHYLLTDGKDLRLYNAAKKLADCWCDNIGPAPKKAWFDGHEEMEQALVRLGRFVNDREGAGKGEKYIALAKFLLDCRRGGGDYDQSKRPLVEQYEAAGHAVRAVYCYSGMTDVAMETGNLEYHSAVQSIWDNLVNTKYYVTGGVGSGETSEGFGKDFSLPNNAYCESCSGCGELFFQYKMNLAYHDAKYADLYENTLYNAILSDLDLEGKNFTYTNPLDTSEARYLWHDCPCCVGNVPRTLLMLPTWMYAKDEAGLFVNLYVGSTVKVENVAGTDVTVIQKTDYPWSGNVSITVKPAAEVPFAIRVRVPQREVSSLYTAMPDSNGITTLMVNGAPVEPVIEKGYAVIDRIWKDGDTIQIELPMKVQRISPSEKIAADTGRVAIRRGPLIYNFESVDQNVDGVIDRKAELSAQWDGKLLGGVEKITGKFVNGSGMTAIPNYARNNRGGRSVVWVRDQ